MTSLTKKVTRKTVKESALTGHRRLVVSLLPGDILEMREVGAKRCSRYLLETIYLWMVQHDVEHEKSQRRRSAPVERGMFRRERGGRKR